MKIQQKGEEMKKIISLLKKCALFDGIDDYDLEAMLGCLGAELRKYKKKEIIWSEGSPANQIGVILSGKVQLVQIDYFGNRSIVASMDEGNLFGETFACAGVEIIPVDIIAAEDTSAIIIDCRKILNSCSNACDFHRKLIFNLMKMVATKNLAFHQKIEITSKRSTREKLMTYLLIQATKNNSDRFEIPYDRQELADYLEVDRSGLSAEISKLRKEGIIESQKNYFHLL